MTALLRFFDREDAAQPDPVRIGQEGFELARAAAVGLQIVPTLIIGAGVFGSYQASGVLDDDVISKILSFASEAQATQLTFRPATAQKLIGLPGPERTVVDKGSVRYLIERIYRRWNDSRAKAYREFNNIAIDEALPSVLVQVQRAACTLSLVTRNPRTGTPTNAEDYRFNVNNRIPAFRSQYVTLISEVENVTERPCQIEFEEDEDSLYIVGLGAQAMSSSAILAFVEDQYAAGRLSDIQVLSMLEPRILGGAVGTSYELISGSRWSVRGITGSPGIASGRPIWSGSSWSDWALKTSPIFVGREASPGDIEILRHCVGAIATRGGKNSHLAVMSRSLGIPAVVGLEEIELDTRHRSILVRGERPPDDFVYIVGASGLVSFGGKPYLRATRHFKNHSPVSFVDWVDELAQSIVDRGEFAALPISAQTHIASLRQMVVKIRAGHD